ncbi:MAG: hypothetical protein ACREEL_11475 [Stellaceae bacterium]
MTDDRDEIRFLRETADRLRSLARQYHLPPGNELMTMADDFDQLADDWERRR